ncbi:hypothetical protein HAV20_11895 [Pseudomonas sp. D-134-1]|nr:hypothetical protein [Stutzerimonas degradans]
MDCSISAAGPVDTDPGLLNDERWAKSAEILLQRGGSNKGELQGDSAPECAQSGVQLYSLINHCDTNPRATGDALRCAPAYQHGTQVLDAESSDHPRRISQTPVNTSSMPPTLLRLIGAWR